VEEVLHAEIGRHRHRVGCHHLAHPHTREEGADGDARPLGSRRQQQEPADEAQPDAADATTCGGAEEADADEQVAERATSGDSRLRGPPQVPMTAPEDGLEDAATVERERRDQVEEPEHEVHGGQPGDRGREQVAEG